MMTANLLSGETSPYLLQHAGNPVHWMPWGSAALRRARQEDKPILLSIGYAACHWCHVMAHESFEDPETADLMNELFVSVKVDREERPDLDAIYQSALAMLGEHGGWPLTMFLTPDGAPFWGGTYFPPMPRYGRPGFREVLRGIAGVYRSEPERIRHNVDALRNALEEASRPRAGDTLTPGTLDQVAARLVQEVDPTLGGLRGAPKFPQAPLFQHLWRAWKRTGESRYRDAVTLTLTRISQGGIYDHLGGGFARYSVDDRWLVPHFEKMLYDNAQLLELLTLVWQETGDPLYATRVEETVGWVLREMAHPDGGFSSSLDADSEGEEGRFYVWTKSEIEDLLGPDAGLFAQYYDVTAAGNWEGKTILNRLQEAEPPDAATEATLDRARRILFEARARRVAPGKDDKVLADWNGLMIAAMVMASVAFARDDWLQAGMRAFSFVRDRMTQNGRLRHAWRAGRLNHPATLDDYANMTRAGLLLHEATGQEDYLSQAEAWVVQVEQHYGDGESGGYFLAADDTPDLLVRNKSAIDNPTPSGNGVMLEVLARLWLVTGRTSYREAADSLVRAFGGEVARNFFPLSTLLSGFELLAAPLQIVIIGDRKDPETRGLARAVRAVSLPNRVLQLVPPGTDLPEGHPAAGKGQVGSRPTAFVCRDQACSLPVTEPDELTTLLGKS